LNPSNVVVRSLWYGCFFGTFLAAILCAGALNRRIPFSQKNVFDKIHVGMQRDDVVGLLRAAGVHCGLTEPANASGSCHFSDFWRDYLIAVDEKLECVARKEVANAGPVEF
jgi:hypothetical protein